MAERSERAVINHLIETCRDAERGFRIAAEYVSDPEMKKVFRRLAEQRYAFAAELLPCAHRLGGAAEGDGTALATAHRTWMELRAHLSSNPERAIAGEASRGERYALAAYDEAVQEILRPEARAVVEAQDLGVRIAGRLVASFAAQ